jgi:hypothetical protein
MADWDGGVWRRREATLIRKSFGRKVLVRRERAGSNPIPRMSETGCRKERIVEAMEDWSLKRARDSDSNDC